MKTLLTICIALLVHSAQAADENMRVRLKDLGRVDGWRDNMLTGYGLVTGLAGTGDSSRNQATRQSIANVMAQFGVNLTSEQVQSRNVAAVMVTANLSPFARRGNKIDVMVSSMGDARSLVGGALLLTPLKGPNGRIYALAQGALSIGGYRYDAFGNLVQKNHPTAGRVPGGGVIEVDVPTTDVSPQGTVTYVLTNPDYTTANQVVQAVNATFGQRLARARDAGSIEIRLPASSGDDDPVAFLTRVENLPVQPGSRAKVVVNERTGTVISGGDVRLSQVTISHGELKVSIATEFVVSQPSAPLVGRGNSNARTVVVPQTRIDVAEDESNNVSLAANHTVADLVKALAKIKTSPRDMISILQGMHSAGALHADLIIQ